MAINVVDGIMETMIAGSCIRDSGWRAAAAYEGERDPGGRLASIHWRSHCDSRAGTGCCLSLDHWEQYDGAANDVRVRAIISSALSAAQIVSSRDGSALRRGRR